MTRTRIPRIPELENCKGINELDGILENLKSSENPGGYDLTTTAGKNSFLMEYMDAVVFVTGEENEELDYLLTKESFIEGHWRDFGGEWVK